MDVVIVYIHSCYGLRLNPPSLNLTWLPNTRLVKSPNFQISGFPKVLPTHGISMGPHSHFAGR